MIPFHPVSEIFPMMQDAELRDLATDIEEHGLIEAIWTYKGQIIDGRNRYRACLIAGEEPRFQEYTGDEGGLVAFVLGLNLKRRHLDASQRAVIGLAVERYEAIRAKERQGAQSNFSHVKEIIPEQERGQARDFAATAVGVNPRYIQDAKRIEAQAPDLIPQIASGAMNIPEAVKKLKERERLAQRAEIAEAGAAVPQADRWHIWQASIETWSAPRQYDCIITDPPYPREYLPLWEVLARRANEWLKPGGLLIAMSGESYLPEIYAMLGAHLDYYWTAAYLTPGQATPLRQVNVNTNWKPLLIYTRKGEKYSGKIFGDVFKSDGNDKDFHKWGQSVSGMLDIVSKMCLPGQYILDPFCGAGTTGIAALLHGCLFDGIDITIENVNIAKGRLHDTAKA